MGGIDRERLAVVMALAGAGDRAAAVMLYVEFGDHVARVMRRHLEALGAVHVDPDDLHGLAIDACFELADRAGSWSPTGGALPWVWAEHRLRQLACRFVGQWSDPLDDAAASLTGPEPATGHDPDEVEVLLALAAQRPDAHLLLEALAAVTTPRNQQVLLAYRLQASLGDRSPANTIGRRFDMTPAAVRQAVKRTSDRLRALIADDPRYRPLDGLALVA